jgi:alkyl hydroperoxide reductase subunit AhpC
MRRFSVALLSCAALSCAASSCSTPRLASSDGLALGAPHPLLADHAPDFTHATPIRGAPIDPKAYEGKVTVVHFWAAWSDESRATLPKLQALYAKYKDRGVAIVALSVDDERGAIDDAIDGASVDFPVAWDATKEVAGRWLVRRVPSSFVIDRRGVVRAAFVRYEDGVEVEIETDVKILAEGN